MNSPLRFPASLPQSLVHFTARAVTTAVAIAAIPEVLLGPAPVGAKTAFLGVYSATALRLLYVAGVKPFINRFCAKPTPNKVISPILNFRDSAIFSALFTTGAFAAVGTSEKEADIIPAWKQILSSINRQTGHMEATGAPLRDGLTMGLSFAVGAYHFFEGSPILAPLAGFFLGLVSNIDRNARAGADVAALKLKTPNSYTGLDINKELFEPALRVIPSRPTEIPDHKRYDAKNPTNYAKNQKPRTSAIPTIRAFSNVLGRLYDFSMMRAGLAWGGEKSFKSSEANPSTINLGNHLIHEVAQQWSRSYGMEVLFKGFDDPKLSDGTPLIWVQNHTSIWPDFLLTLQRPKIRFAARANNYRDNWKVRITGLAKTLSRIGSPFIDGEGATKLIEEMGRLTELGVELLIFPQGTRAPRAYNDDGTIDAPGLYSTWKQNKGKIEYEKFLSSGAALTALQLADKIGNTVSMPVVACRGTHRVMPKISGSQPFIQPARTGQTVTYELVDVISVKSEVGCTARRMTERIEEIMAQMTRSFARGMEINNLLADRVFSWAMALSLTSAGSDLKTTFILKAKDDPRLLMIADRIRSMPVDTAEERASRQKYQRKLIEIVQGASSSREDLLKEVSMAVREAEYKPLPRWVSWLGTRREGFSRMALSNHS